MRESLRRNTLLLRKIKLYKLFLYLIYMKRPLKTGAYCGIALLIIAVISNIITQITGYYKIENAFLYSFFVLVGWIDLLLMIFFIYAFVVLGKKFKSKLLVVMSWIFIGIAILVLVSSVFGSIITLIPKASAATDASQSIENLLTEIKSSNPNLIGELTPEEEKLVATFFIIAWLIISAILGILSILFGIGLLNLRKNVKYAKATGILNIIAGATYIIFIGFIIELAAFIVGVILLFNAAKKFEK